MNKIRIIDLLNKIANNEEVPKTIKIKDTIYKYDKNVKWYFNDFGEDLFVSKDELTREIKIIENDLLDYLISSENNVEILEEEKKIPDKLIPTSLKGINDLEEKIEIAHIDTISVIETVNQLIDYLNSKGE